MWDYVIIIGGYSFTGTKKWQYNFCLQDHTGGPLRIRIHLSRIEGCGITPCPNVPHDIAAIFINKVASRGRSSQLENISIVVCTESHKALAMHPSSLQPNSSQQSSSGLHVLALI